MFPNDPVKAGKIATALFSLLIAATFAFAAFGFNQIKKVADLDKIPSQNTISVSGEGEAYAVPDVALVTYEVTEESKTVAVAQEAVTKTSNDILTYLKSVGVAEKDIKTLNYQIYPRYDYITCYSGSCANNRIFQGYVVTNSVQVKIRKIDDAGKILSELGARKVDNLSNLSFVVDNDAAVTAQARKKAIDDAQQKAEVLARDLGVKLVRIINFSENGNFPMYYDKMMSAEIGYGRGGGMEAPVPDLPAGESKVTSNVSIIYEIR